MAKKYKREEDTAERLEKENRELKALVRSLQRRLKKIDKDYAKEMAEENKERHLKDDFEEPLEFKVKCTHCERGHVIEIDIVGRKFERCTTCDYRKRLNNGKG
jgi:hypothetical protein